MESSIWNTFLVSCTTFGVVFLVFVLLYFVMRAMSLVSRFEKTAPSAEPVAAATPSVAPMATASASPVTPQVVAAITAALVADLGYDNFTISSITPVAKVGGGNKATSAWAQAGREKQMQGPKA